MRPVLLDTGPLVALLDKSDPHHVSCRDALGKVRAPLITTWPVVTEAAHLLASASQDAVEVLLDMLESGAVAVQHLGPGDVSRMRELMRKYGDLPMDLADASVLVLAEREGADAVLTTGKRDFSIYRTKTGGRLKILPGPARTT